MLLSLANPMARAMICAMGCLALLGQPIMTAEPAEKLLEETWDSVYLDGVKTGYAHGTLHEFDRESQKHRRATSDLRLRVKQGQNVMEIRMETGTEENAAGEVRRVFMRQYINKGLQVDLDGTVRGDDLQVKVTGRMSLQRKIAWDRKALSMYREQRFFGDQEVKPKSTLSYRRFETSVNALITVRVSAQDLEEVDVLGKKESLLRIEAVPEKIQTIQLPGTTYWLDKEYRVRRYQMEIPGLGLMVFYRTTAQEAQKLLDDLPDIAKRRLIPIKQRIESPHDTESVVYRITRKKNRDEDLSTLFAVDVRQTYVRIQNDTFELRVKKAQVVEATGKAEKPAAEYLADCHFIKWDDAKVKELAHAAVEKESDSWKQALRIERWVHKNMRMTLPAGDFTPSDKVAQKLEGNVSEYAFLVAAMARALGIPSRTAIGLVYDDSDGQPAMRYHMWTEVWIRGEWLSLDATLEKGMGAAHVKISDHSWQGVKSLTPLLPMMRVWGNVDIEVMSVK